MNQQIIFNDDIAFDNKLQKWSFSGLFAGERIKIIIEDKACHQLNDKLKFDLEADVEEWLEDNEPPIDGEIHLLYK
jgi:hypothetical protein